MFMKPTFLTLPLAAFAAAMLALAQSQQKFSATPPNMTADQQARDAFQKAATVGPNHTLLQSLVGEWSYSMKAWTDPSGTPQEAVGSSTFRSLLEGRFVQQELRGIFMGQPYHGIGLLGYNNQTKQFEQHFFENVKTSQMLMHGSYYNTLKMFIFRGEMDDLVKPGTKGKIRETVRMPDTNTLILEWYETRGGKEIKTMEIMYKRKA